MTSEESHQRFSNSCAELEDYDYKFILPEFVVKNIILPERLTWRNKPSYAKPTIFNPKKDLYGSILEQIRKAM